MLEILRGGNEVLKIDESDPAYPGKFVLQWVLDDGPKEDPFSVSTMIFDKAELIKLAEFIINRYV